jgi:serine O-acetyltransferase
VTIGSGAKLLGPITVGHGSKIGANSVVIHDVPANSTVVGNPGHPVRVEGRRPEGPDADWVHLPDPIADAIKSLASRIAALEDTAEDHGDGNVRPLRPAGDREDGAEAGQRVNRSVGPNPAGG